MRSEGRRGSTSELRKRPLADSEVQPVSRITKMAKTSRKHAWPTKSMRALSSPRAKSGDPAFQRAHPFLFGPHSAPFHARAFKEAADLIIEGLGVQRRRIDHLFYPVAYLYRHALEIQLKDMIRLGRDQGFFRSQAVGKILGKHELFPLWESVRRLLEHEWKGAPSDPLDGIERVVRQFDRADPDGQNLRYELDRDEKPNRYERIPKQVSLKKLRRTMAATFGLLETCQAIYRGDMSDMRPS